MKQTVALIILSIISITGFAVEPDLLILQDGQSLKAYNLDLTSSDNVYYTSSASSDAPLNKISKSEILIIKKADGTKIDPNVSDQAGSVSQNNSKAKTNPGNHTPVTHKAQLGKGNILNVKGDDNQEITMRIISQTDKTLAVTKPRKGLKYDNNIYIIPEYVDFDGDIYTVTNIDENAFKYFNFMSNDTDLKEIVLPITLKEIGKHAFAGREGLQRIIIPDSVEIIENGAFMYCGRRSTFDQLYIPESVKQIGADAFKFVSPSQSYRGFFQGYLTCIPDFVTTANCTTYGIDEEAVEAYEKRRK